MNKKKIVITIIIVLILLAGLGLVTYLLLNDKDKLTVEEKEWLTQNQTVVQSIYVVNNVDVYGKNGEGVFYDFIKSLENEYTLDVNEITYNSDEKIDGKGFKVLYEPTKNSVVFHEEHFVIVSKEKQSFSSLSQLSNKKIGVLTNDEQLANKYIGHVSGATINTYETPTNLFQALDENNDIQYAIIPLEEHLTTILTSNYNIVFHISDMKKYFVYEKQKDDLFSSVLEKYYLKWAKDNLSETVNKNELSTFVNALSISDKDITDIQSKTYSYGFVNNHPYEVLTGGTYGGIVSEYLSRFAEFSKTEFTFTKYKNINKFTEAIANNKIDIFFNYYNLDTKYQELNSLHNIKFVIVASQDDRTVINSVNSLNDETVYVLKNSLLEKYINNLGNMKVKTYTNDKELKKAIKNKEMIIMDKESFNYYHHSILESYNIRYENVLSTTYNFYVKNSDTLSLLFNKYIQTLDPEQLRIDGIYNHEATMKSGTLLGQIAKYSLIIIGLITIVSYVVYRSTKRIKITKKIKKEDKLKYIDQLTSLKNRNYLNENIANWNKNTIYPQATIIIDLNQVQTINDTLGYEQGDAQIKAAANVLIKTQLDNTDIMRTDGNEYLIYMVGYQEKQVVSYIRKLYKEFKNLPYEHGAAIGYSMITNDIKTIEDAINESVDDMRNKKEELENS
jgi:diguanylate cyclase (GGDEF)-like protein